MQKALLLVAGLGAVTVAGAAFAASGETHVLNVPLPDGAIAHVQYVGKVAPRVTVSEAPLPDQVGPFAVLDRSALDMQRQMDAMMRQISAMASQPLTGASRLNVASFGNAPAGSSSVTIVTTSNGSSTCTRRTEVQSQGAGKPPKVVSSQSGDCSGSPSAPAVRGNPT